jgi:hypothetical protein
MKSTIKWQTGTPTFSGPYLTMSVKSFTQEKPDIKIHNYWLQQWPVNGDERIIAWCKLDDISFTNTNLILHRAVFLLTSSIWIIVAAVLWMPSFIVLTIIGYPICYILDGTNILDHPILKNWIMDLDCFEKPVAWLKENLLLDKTLQQFIKQNYHNN